MNSIEQRIAIELSQELQKVIDEEIIMTMTARHEPRLVFKQDQSKPFTLEYGMAYYPGCFTPTGLREHHLTGIKEWCEENDCGSFGDGYTNMYRITFRNEKEMSWFLLRWA